MTSQILLSKIIHRRFIPFKHTLKYNVPSLYLNLDHLEDLNKKYNLHEIVRGETIFCATGITSGDLVSGIKIADNKFILETLVTHKSSGLKKVIKLKQNL